MDHALEHKIVLDRIAALVDQPLARESQEAVMQRQHTDQANASLKALLLDKHDQIAAHRRAIRDIALELQSTRPAKEKLRRIGEAVQRV